MACASARRWRPSTSASKRCRGPQTEAARRSSRCRATIPSRHASLDLKIRRPADTFELAILRRAEPQVTLAAVRCLLRRHQINGAVRGRVDGKEVNQPAIAAFASPALVGRRQAIGIEAQRRVVSRDLRGFDLYRCNRRPSSMTKSYFARLPKGMSTSKPRSSSAARTIPSVRVPTLHGSAVRGMTGPV